MIHDPANPPGSNGRRPARRRPSPAGQHSGEVVARASRAIELAAAGTLPLSALVSRVFPMASLGAAMDLALGGPVMKVLIDPTAG